MDRVRSIRDFRLSDLLDVVGEKTKTQQSPEELKSIIDELFNDPELSEKNAIKMGMFLTNLLIRIRTVGLDPLGVVVLYYLSQDDNCAQRGDLFPMRKNVA